MPLTRREFPPQVAFGCEHSFLRPVRLQSMNQLVKINLGGTDTASMDVDVNPSPVVRLTETDDTRELAEHDTLPNGKQFVYEHSSPFGEMCTV